MRKKDSVILKKLFVVLSMVIVVTLSLVLIDKKKNLPNTFFKDGILSINKIFSVSYGEVYDDTLKSENESLKIYKNENDELREEIKKLKESLDLKKILSDKILINASVLNRNLDYWNESLTIDKGTNDGIYKNMAVVSNGYLVGIVSDTSKDNSNVSLLCNNKLFTSISVKIKIDDNYVYGILNNYKDGFFEIMGIVENVVIPSGTSVFTSGLSENIPSGIVLGIVDSVDSDNFDLSKIVKVVPGTNFDDIKYVTVVKGDL